MNVELPVNEIFHSIQGEGTHAGRPALFIRLQGCPVGCPWCDSKATWYVDQAQQIDAWELQTKTESGVASWAHMTVPVIGQAVSHHSARHVVVTGGEPCLYDLTPLTVMLSDKGYSVQIETSGTQPVRVAPETWVTVSPKVNMPGDFVVLADALARADEIKMPIGRADDLEVLFSLLRLGAVRPDVPVWLQPLSTARRATELCRVAAMANNFRVSLQLHQYAGWR